MREVRVFLADDSGAVTIDWVALTAGILLLGIAVVYSIFGNGVTSVVDQITGSLDAVSPVSTGAAPDFQYHGDDFEYTWNPSMGDFPGVYDGDTGTLTVTNPETGATTTINGVTSTNTGPGEYTYTNEAGQVVATEQHTGQGTSAAEYSIKVYGDPQTPG